MNNKEKYIQDNEDHDIIEDDELFLFDDNNLIYRMEAQNKRRNPSTIKRVKNDYN